MKKILLTSFLLLPVFAFAQATTTAVQVTTTSAIATSTKPVLNVSCIQTALDKRENALISAHDVMNTAIKTALEARKNSLKSAWALTSPKERKVAREQAYKIFRDTTKQAHETMKSSRKSTWNTFDADMKACGVKGRVEFPQKVNFSPIEL